MLFKNKKVLYVFHPLPCSKGGYFRVYMSLFGGRGDWGWTRVRFFIDKKIIYFQLKIYLHMLRIIFWEVP